MTTTDTGTDTGDQNNWLTDHLREAVADLEAELTWIREQVVAQLSGHYMPTPEAIVRLLYPSHANIRHVRSRLSDTPFPDHTDPTVHIMRLPKDNNDVAAQAIIANRIKPYIGRETPYRKPIAKISYWQLGFAAPIASWTASIITGVHTVTRNVPEGATHISIEEVQHDNKPND